MMNQRYVGVHVHVCNFFTKEKSKGAINKGASIQVHGCDWLDHGYMDSPYA